MPGRPLVTVVCLQADAAIYMNFEGVLGAVSPGAQHQLQHAGGTPLHVLRPAPSLARRGVESDMLSSISSANTASLHNGSDQVLVLVSLAALGPRRCHSRVPPSACFLFAFAVTVTVAPTAQLSVFPPSEPSSCRPLLSGTIVVVLQSSFTLREPSTAVYSSPVR